MFPGNETGNVIALRRWAGSPKESGSCHSGKQDPRKTTIDDCKWPKRASEIDRLCFKAERYPRTAPLGMGTGEDISARKPEGRVRYRAPDTAQGSGFAGLDLEGLVATRGPRNARPSTGPSGPERPTQPKMTGRDLLGKGTSSGDQGGVCIGQGSHLIGQTDAVPGMPSGPGT